jgi:hypothetical protein
MPEYGNLHYEIDRPVPSELFLKARQIAGCQLQEQFRKLNTGIPDVSYNSFKWIKSELTYPSFDPITFAYKNAVFSVIIELIDEDQTSMTKNQIERLVKATEKNNIIPCVFRLKMKRKQRKSFHRLINTEYSPRSQDLEMIPIKNEWNLCHIRTGIEVIPENIGNEVEIKMSDWELQNFAIQIARNGLEKEGISVLSFCDLLEVNPQIWFRDKQGNICWSIVKHITEKPEEKFQEWVGFENANPKLKDFDGFFATVQFNSTRHNGLIRGDCMNFKYSGLKRIYVKL